RRALVAAVDSARVDEPHRSGGLHHVGDAWPQRPRAPRPRDRGDDGSRRRAAGVRHDVTRPGASPLPPTAQRALIATVTGSTTPVWRAAHAGRNTPSRPAPGGPRRAGAADTRCGPGC